MPSSVVAATLIADPDQLRLSDAHIMRAAQGATGFESWLNEGVAADLFFSAPLETIRAALDEARAGEPFDFVVQPAADRQNLRGDRGVASRGALGACA